MKQKVSFFFSFVSFFLFSSQTRVDFVSNCLKEVTITYIRPGIISVYYPPAYESPVSEHIEPAIQTLMQGNRWTLEIFSGSAQPLLPYLQKKKPSHQAVLIFLGQQSSWKTSIKLISSKRILDPDTKVFILMKGVTERRIVDVMGYVWLKLRLFNVYGLSVNERNVTFHTFDPFFTNYFIVSVINTWTDHFESSEPLFPDRITPNLARFVVRLLISMTFGQQENFTCRYSLETIIESLGMKVFHVVRIMFPEKNLSHLNKEFKFSSALGYLNRQEVDVACVRSFIMGDAYFHNTEPLPAMIHTESFWIVRKPQLITGWRTLIVELSKGVWLGVLFTYFLASSAIYIYYRLKKIRKPYPNVLFGVYGMHMDNPPANLDGYRPGTWVFLLYLVVITTVYKSNPRQEVQIKSLEEGVAAGYVLCLFNGTESWVQANQNENNALKEAVESGRVEYDKGHGYERIHNRSHAISTFDNVIESKALSIHHKHPFNDYLLRTFDFLPGSFFIAQEGAYMSPANPLTAIFVRKQLQIIEAGLNIYWELEPLIYSSKRIGFKYQGPQEISSEKPKPISLHQIHAFFGLYLVCVSISFLFFIFEKILNLNKMYLSMSTNVQTA